MYELYIISFFETWANVLDEFSNFLPSFTAYESVRKKSQAQEEIAAGSVFSSKTG